MSTIPAQVFDGVSIPETIYAGKNTDYTSPGRFTVTPTRTFKTSVGTYAFQALDDTGDNKYLTILASDEYFTSSYTDGSGGPYNALTYTYNTKTVFYNWFRTNGISESIQPRNNYSINDQQGNPIYNLMTRLAWLMVYGENIPDGYAVTYDLTNCSGDSGNPSIIPPNATITNMDFTPDSNYSFNSGSCWVTGDGFPSGTPIQYVFEPETGHLKVGVITSDITIHVTAFGDPYQTIDGESDIPGGDSIPIPSLPSLSAVASGVIGLFNPTISQMQLLADYMWTDFGGTGATTEDILKEIVQAIKRSISNPLDYVIGLNIIPSAGLSVGASTTIRFGFVSSNVSMPRLTSQFFVVDCGTLSFNALCGDTFLDYAPYSKFSIYLPYIGVKDVDANDFVNHTIGVIYHGDVVTGGITAYVTKDGSVMYQYSGCCALNIPLTADNWGNTISGAVQIATALITGTVAGGSAGIASSAVKSVSSVAVNPSLLSPQVSRSGAVSGGAGCMAVQKPFVIREAVRFHSTSGFNTVSGYPSYYFKALSEMHGYTVCYDVHLTGIPATENEINEIENLLKEGVVF